MIATSRSKNTKKIGVTIKGLEDQLLLHEELGERKITVIDYYNRYIAPFNAKYSRKFSGIGSKVVCPFHDDIAPSMGVLEDSKRGVQVFNCFGCGAKGTVITMHERFCKEHRKIQFPTHLDYIKLLAELYDVELKDEVTYAEVVDNEPKTNFNKEIGYNLRMHQRNVEKIRLARDTLSVDELKHYWEEISKRIVLNMSKK